MQRHKKRGDDTILDTTPETYHFTLDEGEPVIARGLGEAWTLFDKYRERIVSANREPFKTILDTQRPTNEQDSYD